MGYWDIEDGSDCFQKTWITTKWGTVLGLVGSAYHIVAFQPKTAMQAAERAAAGTLTMAAMGAIFGMTTCMSAQLREKPDDPWNYFAGGCASGILLGVRTHSYMTGTSLCLALGTVAALTKIGKMEGWRLVGPPRV
ncbi:NADH dehydrogenase [ubiquinone] 1 alpha subcomplex subunit 11 [Protopterus annectens]|uniref:NADH dehydrogenase [ubiquinone] 1 alpha subcomplex subunit 11 n=1 Tax=Protopterus annectens TaxID=7888 RepID=UPI001CFA5945|nr:NADH dehydrogenase [ubiquinone] 1 alpha subcomplex subunit 11 [Protopterus annectens]